jgi:hypothetical protein
MRKIKYDVVCIGLVRICHGYNTVDDLGLLESIGSWIGAAPCRMCFNLRIDEGMPDIDSPRSGVLDNVEFLRKKGPFVCISSDGKLLDVHGSELHDATSQDHGSMALSQNTAPVSRSPETPSWKTGRRQRSMARVSAPRQRNPILGSVLART